MAFSLTKVRAYGIEAEEPLNNWYQQKLILNITGLATDVDLDLGDYSGTFWSAVDGAEPGDTALQAIKDIQTIAESFLAVQGTALAPLMQQQGLGGQAVYTSAASAGGSATESLTVTGLAVGDTIIAATKIAAGANAEPISAIGAVGANSLSVTFDGDPGAGATVRVLVQKGAAASGVVTAGGYQLTMDSTNTLLPNLLFASGSAPTSYVIELSWILKDNQEPVFVEA